MVPVPVPVAAIRAGVGSTYTLLYERTRRPGFLSPLRNDGSRCRVSRRLRLLLQPGWPGLLIKHLVQRYAGDPGRSRNVGKCCAGADRLAR